MLLRFPLRGAQLKTPGWQRRIQVNRREGCFPVTTNSKSFSYNIPVWEGGGSSKYFSVSQNARHRGCVLGELKQAWYLVQGLFIRAATASVHLNGDTVSFRGLQHEVFLHAFAQNLNKKGEAALRIRMSPVFLSVFKTPWPFQLAPQHWCDNESLRRRESEELYSQSSLSIFSSVWHRYEWRRLPELADPRYETEERDWIYFGVSLFHCTLLSCSADCTGAAREGSSEIIPQVRPLSALPAGWGRNSVGTCSSLTGLCLELPHPRVLRCAWCDTAFTKPAAGTLGQGQSPASTGVSSEAGHLLFQTCRHLRGGFLSSTDGWKQCQWCHSTELRLRLFQILTLMAGHSLWPCKHSLAAPSLRCSQWSSPDNSWSMSYSPALPVMAKHGTWCCWPRLTGSHTSTDFPKLLLGWTLLSFTQQGWLVHTPSNKGLQINSKTQ